MIDDEPAAGPQLQMLQTQKMIRLSDEDYQGLIEQTLEAPLLNSTIFLDMDGCNLKVYIWKSIRASMGDKFFTPKEEIPIAEVLGFEAEDASGEDVVTDFDPVRLQQAI